MPELDTIGYAFIGGFFPALFWLYFLLKEEGRCPQPRWTVFLAFLGGMIAVPLVIPFQQFACDYFASCNPAPSAHVILFWAMTEETVKYLLAAVFVLWRTNAIRNPIDIVGTMITTALGFAALENVLFLIQPLTQELFLAGFVSGNLRFIGATLLHVIASSAIGFALAFSWKAKRPLRALAASLCLILAIGLHAVFNFFIMQEDGSHTILAFFTVWTGAIVFFAAFEILKYLRYRNLPKNTC